MSLVRVHHSHFAVGRHAHCSSPVAAIGCDSLGGFNAEDQVSRVHPRKIRSVIVSKRRLVFFSRQAHQLTRPCSGIHAWLFFVLQRRHHDWQPYRSCRCPAFLSFLESSHVCVCARAWVFPAGALQFKPAVFSGECSPRCASQTLGQRHPQRWRGRTRPCASQVPTARAT